MTEATKRGKFTSTRAGSCYDYAHVETWQKTGAFPAIHQDLADAVVTQAEGRSILDLCCNHGMLGQQLCERLPGRKVVGVEGDRGTVDRANRAGLGFKVYVLRLDPSNYDDLGAIMREHAVDVVVARRCISEILATALWSAREFASTLADAGARELFLQGRAPTPNATHPIPNVEAEIAAMSGRYALVWKNGQLAYLRAAG